MMATPGPSGLSSMFSPQINYERGAGIRDALSLIDDYRGKRVLDFGCGSAPLRRRLEQGGAHWVGIDLDGPGPSVRCDGHQLPFTDASFDIVVADAVFEHLTNPHLAAGEIARVCRPGGHFIGYVAFLESFHSSFFHHSHRGIETVLTAGGFRVTDILPTRPGIEKLLEDMIFARRLPIVTTAVSRLVRLSLSLLKLALLGMAGIALMARHEPRSARTEKLRLYRTLLDVGYSAGLLFKAARAPVSDGSRTTRPAWADMPPVAGQATG